MTGLRRSEQRGAIAWMAGNSVAANLFMAVLLVGGLIMAKNIKQEVFPEFTIDSVTISVPYPSASPAEVERGIVLAVEEAVQGLDNVDEVRSTASEGRAVITVDMVEGGDLQKLSQDIQNEVDGIDTFPDEAEEPTVAITSRKRDVISMAVYGEQSDWVLRQTAEDIRDRFIQDPDITQVDLGAIRDFEIAVDVPQETLRRYDLTLNRIADLIGRAAMELPGGSVKTESGEILMRMKERREYAHEFGLIPVITTPEGTEVLLEDIAEIRDDFEDSDVFAFYNGMPAVMIDVYRIGDQTPITVADAVRRHVTELKQTLPDGLHVEVVSDKSEIYRQRMELLVKNGYLGLGLVFLFLALFLEARLAFWVSMGIPISFLGSMLLLPGAGLSLNMVSMFAFIVTLGIVVDDAIVVGENIYSYRQKGMTALGAAIRGAREIAMPVTFSVLTNVIAFLPMYFIPGIMGKIFKHIPVVVISVFLISLVESLFILPAHLGHQKKRSLGGLRGWLHSLQQRFSTAFITFVHAVFGPFLDAGLRFRYVTVGIGLAVLLVTAGFVKSGRMGMTLFPSVESDYAKVTAVLPYGSSVERSTAVMQELTAAAEEVVDAHGGNRLSQGIFAQVNGNEVVVRIFLTAPEVRPMGTGRVTQLWRQRTGSLPGLESIDFQADSGGPGAGKGLTIELSHRDMDVLEAAGADLAAEVASYPKTKDVEDGFAPGKEQLDFHITPLGRSRGLRSRDVAAQVRAAFYGVEALQQQRGRNEVTVRVRLPENERITEQDIDNLILRTDSGREIPLREAVTMERGRSYTSIDRRNGRRVINVRAAVTPRSEVNQVLSDLQRSSLPDLVRKYPGLRYSFEGRSADMRESIQAMFQGLLFAALAIYAMLAIPFKSYIQPVIIMIAIPFGVVGAIVGHLVMGYSLSILSLFGIVALSGVVVNDSLVLIDFANRRKREGQNGHDAILGAALQRFRPILLTTLTTCGGLAPMILETSRQARFLIPMAISLGFGILFATMITLILVPCLYMIIEDVLGVFRSGSEKGSVTESRTGNRKRQDSQLRGAA
jgi:multidrug efflux pump subunit AcrB